MIRIKKVGFIYIGLLNKHLHIFRCPRVSWNLLQKNDGVIKSHELQLRAELEKSSNTNIRMKLLESFVLTNISIEESDSKL